MDVAWKIIGRYEARLFTKVANMIVSTTRITNTIVNQAKDFDFIERPRWKLTQKFAGHFSSYS